LIPYEEKWNEVEVNKPFNIFVQRGWGHLIPYEEKWNEVEVDKPFNIFVQRGWGHLIPYEEKWKLINHSTYLFRRGQGDLIDWKRSGSQ